MHDQELGLNGNEVRLVCPEKMSNVWKESVAEAKKELSEVFSSNVVEIQEVGSGAIQNEDVTVYCKPIIDLAVGVNSIDEARDKIGLMKSLGYLHRFKRDNDNRIFFIKRTETGEHTHHIYVLTYGCRLWNELIQFKDYLEINSDKLRKYMMIKRELSDKYPKNRNLYNRSRAKFMHNVVNESKEYFILNHPITVSDIKDMDGFKIGINKDEKQVSGKDQTVYLIGDAGGNTSEVTAKVIAIVHLPQEGDVLVATEEDRIIYEPEIENTLRFKDKFPDVKYSCSHEKSCGAVLFTKVDGERKYLLIKNRSLHAGFPKGHIEYGETELETVRREILEETGLSVNIIDGFRRDYEYKVRFFINKTAVYFLASFEGQKIVPQEGEVLDYWIIPLEEALKHLGFEQDQKILKDADDFLNDFEQRG